MFKDVPDKDRRTPPTRSRSRSSEMDRYGIERALIGVGGEGGTASEALKRYPDRFIPCLGCRPQ